MKKKEGKIDTCIHTWTIEGANELAKERKKKREESNERKTTERKSLVEIGEFLKVWFKKRKFYIVTSNHSPSVVEKNVGEVEFPSHRRPGGSFSSLSFCNSSQSPRFPRNRRVLARKKYCHLKPGVFTTILLRKLSNINRVVMSTQVCVRKYLCKSIVTLTKCFSRKSIQS